MFADARRWRRLLLSAALLALPLAAVRQEARPDRPESDTARDASLQPPGRVVVGSKNFTESHILGDLLTLMLEAHTELEVEHRASLGGTLVCFQALRSGELDMYVEYTGTGWAIVLKEEERVTDALRVYLHVQSRYRDLYDLEWLPPLGLENSYALAMDEERAEELGIATVSDLIEHQDELRAGFSIEFMNREDGYPGLAQHYGLELADAKSMEHGLAYEAIANRAIDLVDAYTTDGKLLRYHLRILEDDRDFFPPYDAAPIVRRELLEARPQVREVLERLAFTLSDERMMELNHAVEVEGKGFREVARAFLEQEGLIEQTAAGPKRPGRGAPFLDFFLGRWRETLRLGLEHVQLTAIAVLLAALLAIPLGIAITQSRLAERLFLGAAGIVQTIPSIALLAFLVAVPGFGLSVRSAIAALFVYSVLPILRNTYTGIAEVSHDLVDAARGMGLTRFQILTRIQLPLATRTILAGIRTATVIGIGVATLAAFIGAGGLGEPIVTGLYLNDTQLVLAGALPAALLALLADGLLGLLERAFSPRGLRADH